MKIAMIRASLAPLLVAVVLACVATLASGNAVAADPCSDCEAPLSIDTSLQDWTYLEYNGQTLEHSTTVDFVVSTGQLLGTGKAEVSASVECESGFRGRFELEAFETGAGGGPRTRFHGGNERNIDLRLHSPLGAASAKGSGAPRSP